MKHCYILDFDAGQVLHAEVPDRVAENNDEIETYLRRNYSLDGDEISFMITENERSIINLD